MVEFAIEIEVEVRNDELVEKILAVSSDIWGSTLARSCGEDNEWAVTVRVSSYNKRTSTTCM